MRVLPHMRLLLLGGVAVMALLASPARADGPTADELREQIEEMHAKSKDARDKAEAADGDVLKRVWQHTADGYDRRAAMLDVQLKNVEAGRPAVMIPPVMTPPKIVAPPKL